MNQRRFVPAFALLLVASAFRPEISLADERPDGNLMLRSCRAAVEMFDAGGPGSGTSNDRFAGAATCIGYLRGIRDLAAYWNLLLSPFMRQVGRADLSDHGAGSPFCIPENVNPAQLARVIVKYLENHPEKLHEEDIVLTVEALTQAFPCMPGKTKSTSSK